MAVDESDWKSAAHHFATLVVEPQSTVEEITKAYTALSKLHHPDLPAGNLEKCVKVQESYDALVKNPIPLLTRQDAQACLLTPGRPRSSNDSLRKRKQGEEPRVHFADRLADATSPLRKVSSPRSNSAEPSPYRKISSPRSSKRPRKFSDPPPESWDHEKHSARMLACHTVAELENYYDLLMRMRPIQFKMAWEVQTKISERGNEAASVGAISPARIKPLRFSVSDAWVQQRHQATFAALAPPAPLASSCTSSSSSSASSSSASSLSSSSASSSSSSSSCAVPDPSSPVSSYSGSHSSTPNSHGSHFLTPNGAEVSSPLRKSSLSACSKYEVIDECEKVEEATIVNNTAPVSAAANVVVRETLLNKNGHRPPPPKRAPPARPVMPKRRPPSRPVLFAADVVLPNTQPFQADVSSTNSCCTASDQKATLESHSLTQYQTECRISEQYQIEGHAPAQYQTEPAVQSSVKVFKRSRRWGFHRRSSADNDKENQGRREVTSEHALGLPKKTTQMSWHTKLHISHAN